MVVNHLWHFLRWLNSWAERPIPRRCRPLCLVVLLLLTGGWVFGQTELSPSTSPTSLAEASAASINLPDSRPAQLVASGPEEVMTGFYLISGGKLDFQNSTVPIDFYFWMTYPGTETPKIEFMNSRNFILTPQTTQTIEGPNGRFQNICYRVTGTFDQDLDMKKYPFDRFKIRILAEDTEKTIQERVFVPDTGSTGIDASFKILGWNVTDRDIRTTTHAYASTFGVQNTEGGQERYSQIIFEMDISRDHAIIFIKIVSPVLLFLSIAALGLFLNVDQISQKISLSVAALFSSVAYHINVTQGLPPVGYLTFIDRMMLGQYLVIFMNLLFCVGLFWTNKNEHKRLERILLITSRILVPLAALCVLWVLFSQVEFS